MIQLLLVAMISTIVSSPLSLIVQYLIMGVLCCETKVKVRNGKVMNKDNEESNNNNNKINERSLRRKGFNFENKEDSVIVELKNLLRELNEYRKRLKGSKLEEFDDIWKNILKRKGNRIMNEDNEDN